MVLSKYFADIFVQHFILFIFYQSKCAGLSLIMEWHSNDIHLYPDKYLLEFLSGADELV